VKTTVETNAKITAIQNEVRFILQSDESKDDETSIGFPSGGILIKSVPGKVKLNKDLQTALLTAKLLTFDACLLNKATNENPLVGIMSYLYYSMDFSRLNIPEKEFFNYIYAIQELYFKENKYHNHIHSADVTQSMIYYFRTCGVKTSCKVTDFEEFTAYLGAGIHDVHH
jgi:hypothetical protein